MGDLIRQFASVLIEIWRHKKHKKARLYLETCYLKPVTILNTEIPEAYSETC